MMEKIGTVTKNELTVIIFPCSDDQAFFKNFLHVSIRLLNLGKAKCQISNNEIRKAE